MANITLDMFEAANDSRVYSPVSLNNEWSRISRLLFTVLCTVLGTLSNGFFVASFCVEKSLKQAGLVYMACAGLSDLIVTSSVMPVSAVVLLSGEWDTEHVCLALQSIAEGSTYSYNIFFMLSALEALYKFCEQPEYNVKLSLTLQTIFIFSICMITAFCGVYINLDYDYCNRQHEGDPFFTVSTFVIFTAVPFVVTVYALLRASCRIRNKARRQSHYKRSQLHEQESTTNKLNIAAYFLFSISWAPYIVVVHIYPDASDSRYYHSAWIGVFRSVITSLMYGFLDKVFRRAFAHLFNYMCCKNSLSASYASRHRNRAVEYKSPVEVRVHIMHQAVNPNSPRAGSSSRDVQEL